MARLTKWGYLLGVSLLVSGCGESIPSGNPKNRASSEMHGYSVRQGAAIGKELSFHWMQKLVTGWDAKDTVNFPSKVKILKDIRGCKITPRLKNELFSSVLVWSSSQRSTIRRVSPKKIAKQAKTWVKHYQRGNASYVKNSGSFDSAGNTMGVIDVVVTDTSKPHYLVLFGQDHTIWNIHPTKGVKIARIVLIHGKSHGIVNVPDGTVVESLVEKRARKCRFTGPFPMPREHWNFVKNEIYIHKALNSEAYRRVVKYYTKFSSWHRKVFGRSAKEMIYAPSASHVLIGPAPTLEQRAVYRPIKDSTISVSGGETLHVLDQKDWFSLGRKLIKKHIEEKFHLSLDDISKG